MVSFLALLFLQARIRILEGQGGRVTRNFNKCSCRDHQTPLHVHTSWMWASGGLTFVPMEPTQLKVHANMHSLADFRGFELHIFSFPIWGITISKSFQHFSFIDSLMQNTSRPCAGTMVCKTDIIAYSWSLTSSRMFNAQDAATLKRGDLTGP